jgi:hypothetical protein
VITQLKFHCETGRRYLVVLAISLWLGGFTFYSVVVIHTAHHVLDSMLETGLITQQVSGWLNWIGIGTLAILLWNVFASWRTQNRLLRNSLATMWLVMTAVEIWLFLLHPMLDKQINLETHHLVDRVQFRNVHTLYVTLSTVQWGAGLIYIFVTLQAWRNIDSTQATNSSREAIPGSEHAIYQRAP